MTRVLLSIILAAWMAGCHAEPDTAGPADRWREKVHAAKRHVRELGQPREVLRGARPEIVLRDGRISYNGKPLVLDTDLEEWRRVLGPATLCDGDHRKYDIHCWKNLGIWVGHHPSMVIV